MCRLKLKMVARVTMAELAQHLAQQLSEWPAQQLQALEIVVNSPFINNTDRLIYSCRSLFYKQQVLSLFHVLLCLLNSVSS
jgi:hypothetical protein